MTELVSEETERIVRSETNRIISGKFDVFFGPVSDRFGQLRVRKGENLPDTELLNHMDWYVRGVDVE